MASASASPRLPCPAATVDEFLSEPTPEVVAALRDVPGPILVLGAGGKMGLHLTAMLQGGLRAAGSKAQAIAVSRFGSVNAQEDFTRLGLATLACDLEDPAALARLPDSPTVFFLAGIKFGTASALDLLHRFNVEMPARVAERFSRSRLVAFSTGGVYPWVAPASGGATEATPPAPVGEYAASCLGRERAFAAASLSHGTPVTLLRLNYSVEFRYGVLVDIAQKVLAGEPVDVTMGYVNAIWQRDAVAHTVQSLVLAGAPAVPFNVTGPDILAVREVAGRFGRWFGKTPTIVGTEGGTALLNNASFGHRRFGAPRVSPEQMMEWVAAWLLRGGPTLGKPTHFEVRDGKY